MAEQIYHNDFDFIDDISPDDLKKADSMRRKRANAVKIVICTVMLIFFVVLLVYCASSIGIFKYMILSFCGGCAAFIAFAAYHLLYGSVICGLSYGIVKNKQTKDKLLTGHMGGREIYPWDEDDYDRNADKPLSSQVKAFYYVDVSMCSMDSYMEHICCYKDDFEKLKEGDKVILIRFRNKTLIAVPATAV